MKRLHLLATLPLGILGYVAMPSSVQAAPACATDADCQVGYTCNIVAVGGCAVAPCSEGEECPPPPSCEMTEIRQCSPGAACASDADCSPELRCVTSTTTRCSAGGSKCPRGEECPPPPPPECETTTKSSCQPRYGSACSTSAECGAGLQCVHSQTCQCSGGGAGGGTGVSPTPQDGGARVPADAGRGPTAADPAANYDAGVPVPPPATDAGPPDTPKYDDGGTPVYPEECTCTDDGPQFCDLVQKDCAQESDCPPGWACEEAYSVSCAVSPDSDATCILPPVPKQCVSPFGWSVPVTTTPSQGKGGSTGYGPELSDAGAVPPDPPVDIDDSNSGQGGSTGNGPGHSHSGFIDLGGGISCQVGSAPNGLIGTAWLTAVGLAALVTRRRRRSS